MFTLVIHRWKSAPRYQIVKGTVKAPIIKSANAMLMTKNKLFLRSVLLRANRTMVSKFPATISTDSKIKALHHAMPSALEGTAIDKPVAFSKLVLATDVLFIVDSNNWWKRFALCGVVNNHQNFSVDWQGQKRIAGVYILLLFLLSFYKKANKR